MSEFHSGYRAYRVKSIKELPFQINSNHFHFDTEIFIQLKIAKKKIYGDVGIDMIAGPSEILVVADSSNNPKWIAADLLSQSEHDKSAQSILVTDNESFANDVDTEITNILSNLPRADIARESWNKFGAIILVPNINSSSFII